MNFLGGHQRRGSGGTVPQKLKSVFAFHLQFIVYVNTYTMNVVNTQLSQLYYIITMSVFHCLYIFSVKIWGEGHNEHVVIFGGGGGHMPLVPHRFLCHYMYVLHTYNYIR